MIRSLFSKEIRLETEYLTKGVSERIPKVKTCQKKVLKTEVSSKNNIRKSNETDSLYPIYDMSNRRLEGKASNSQSFINTVNEINDEMGDLNNNNHQEEIHKTIVMKSNQSTIENNIYKINKYIKENRLKSIDSDYYNKETQNLINKQSKLKVVLIELKSKSEMLKNSISENKIRLNERSIIFKDLLSEYNAFKEHNLRLENQIEDMKAEETELRRRLKKEVFEFEEKGFVSKSKLENRKRESELEFQLENKEYEEKKRKSREVKSMLDKYKKELLELRRVLKESEYKNREKSYCFIKG